MTNMDEMQINVEWKTSYWMAIHRWMCNWTYIFAYFAVCCNVCHAHKD